MHLPRMALLVFELMRCRVCEQALTGMLLERGLVAMVSKAGARGSYSSITLTPQVCSFAIQGSCAVEIARNASFFNTIWQQLGFKREVPF